MLGWPSWSTGPFFRCPRGLDRRFSETTFSKLQGALSAYWRQKLISSNLGHGGWVWAVVWLQPPGSSSLTRSNSLLLFQGLPPHPLQPKPPHPGVSSTWGSAFVYRQCHLSLPFLHSSELGVGYMHHIGMKSGSFCLSESSCL